MARTELSRRETKIINTVVEFDIDWTIVECDIPHYMPKDEAEIQQNIQNRENSEREILLQANAE